MRSKNFILFAFICSFLFKSSLQAYGTSEAFHDPISGSISPNAMVAVLLSKNTSPIKFNRPSVPWPASATSHSMMYSAHTEMLIPPQSRWWDGDSLGNLYAYAENNPGTYIDPLGLDVWIEEASPGEPWLHRSISIGNPQTGQYRSYSFGVSSFTLRYGLTGVIYREANFDRGGRIVPDKYLKTTPEEDAQLIKALEAVVRSQQNKSYRLINRNCRTFSDYAFDVVKNAGIGTPSPPPIANTRPIFESGYKPGNKSLINASNSSADAGEGGKGIISSSSLNATSSTVSPFGQAARFGISSTTSGSDPSASKKRCK